MRVDRAVQVRFVNSLSPSLALAHSHTYTHSLSLYTYKAMLFSLFFMLQSGQFVRPVGCDIAPVPFLPHFSLGFNIFLLLFSRCFFSHRASVCLQSMFFFLARSLQIIAARGVSCGSQGPRAVASRGRHPSQPAQAAGLVLSCV